MSGEHHQIGEIYHDQHSPRKRRIFDLRFRTFQPIPRSNKYAYECENSSLIAWTLTLGPLGYMNCLVGNAEWPKDAGPAEGFSFINPSHRGPDILF